MLLENIKTEDFEEIYTILENTFPQNEMQPKNRLYDAYLRKDFLVRN